MTVLHDDQCAICEKWAIVNDKGQCHRCWMAYDGWTPPANLLSAPSSDMRERDENDEYKPVVVAVPDRADSGALFDNYLANVDSDSWRLDKGWKPDDLGPFGVYHRPADPPVAPKGQQRPWQRYGWQIEGKKTRTSPHRIDNGVSLRCLVCLAEGGPLRRDQVCDACERNWRDHGRPWDFRYDAWVIMRRIDTGQPEMIKVTGVPSGGTGPSTCDVTNSGDDIPYNGTPGNGNSDPELSGESPSEEKMVEVTFRGEPAQVVAAIKKMGSPEEPRVAQNADKRELGEIVALRRHTS